MLVEEVVVVLEEEEEEGKYVGVCPSMSSLFG